jgi:hypothetical protein
LHKNPLFKEINMKLGFQGATTMTADLQTDVAATTYAGFEKLELWAAKALYQRGVYFETNPEHKRQAFVRWLYLQGRLQS